MPHISELITFRGETDGTNTTGIVPLKAAILYGGYDLSTGSTTTGTTKSISIPVGMKAKIWAIRGSGADTTFTVQYCWDLGDETTCIDIASIRVSGQETIEKRKPIVLESANLGKDGIKVAWSQPTAGKAEVELDIEFADE